MNLKSLILSLLAMSSALSLKAQAQVSNEKPEADLTSPWMEYVMELKVTVDGAYGVGDTSHGNRYVIPITGGTFEGPRLRGTVIPGGADYQMIDSVKGRTELEAIYSIRTDDGVNIHIRNTGILYTGKNENGEDTFYFRTTPKFEAPKDSQYDWLNNYIFICVPQVLPDYISLKVWKVE